MLTLQNIQEGRAAVSRALLVVAVLGIFAATSHAGSISYGNFGPVPPGVVFTNVTESSATDSVPLYGPPMPFATGLDFNPIGFASSATAGSSDITDGQLNFGIS